MSEIKIVSIDIDGTLINDRHEITPEVKRAVQAAMAQGVKIVITWCPKDPVRVKHYWIRSICDYL